MTTAPDVTPEPGQTWQRADTGRPVTIVSVYHGRVHYHRRDPDGSDVHAATDLDVFVRDHVPAADPPPRRKGW